LSVGFSGQPGPERTDFDVSLSTSVSDEGTEILADADAADLVGEDDEEDKFPDGKVSRPRLKFGVPEDLVLQLATDLKVLLKERGRSETRQHSPGSVETGKPSSPSRLISLIGRAVQGHRRLVASELRSNPRHGPVSQQRIVELTQKARVRQVGSRR
jgi:hypothetical protein